VEVDRLSSDFSHAFDEAVRILNYRFNIPAYWFFERILPYARNLHAHIDLVHRTGHDLVKEGLERFSQEELGEKDVSTERDLILR